VKILIVDDDRDLVDLLTFAMRRAGLEVIGITDPLDALPAVQRESPDCIVLDINLGGWSGLDLLREIRRRSDVPVIMLTARDAEADKLRGFELGADDYVTKPFSHRELIARINVQRGRAPGLAKEVTDLRAGPLHMDLATHTVTRDGTVVALTVREFRLLHRLMLEPGTVVSSDALLRSVWGHAAGTETDVLRVTLHRLRRKLGDDPAEPGLIRTVPGVGIALGVRPAREDDPSG
jgi:DNA-binding response OmpR family regulator